MEFTDRVSRVEPSAPLAISTTADELRADGTDVVDLSVGEPDVPTPTNVVAAAKAALDDGHTGYTPSKGIAELRKAIAESLRSDGLDHTAEDVVVTPGGKHALYVTFQTLVQEGDEVILLDPAWVSYESMVSLASGSLSRVDLTPHEFRLEPALDDLATAMTDDTALLIVNSPSNPSGVVYSERALEAVRDLAIDHDVTVVSDEIYGEITYDIDQTSIGSLEGMADRTVTINGFSKAYSMTGWRLGYLAGPPAFVAQAERVHSHSVSCAANFVQRAGVEALTAANGHVERTTETLERRRDLLVDLLKEHGVDVAVPDGAFYLMLPVSADDRAWCERALEEAYVATVPGRAFGTPGYARLSYAKPAERLREAIRRLAEHGYL